MFFHFLFPLLLLFHTCGLLQQFIQCFISFNIYAYNFFCYRSGGTSSPLLQSLLARPTLKVSLKRLPPDIVNSPELFSESEVSLPPFSHHPREPATVYDCNGKWKPRTADSVARAKRSDVRNSHFDNMHLAWRKENGDHEYARFYSLCDHALASDYGRNNY